MRDKILCICTCILVFCIAAVLITYNALSQL
jgi:hypothetical protein